MVEGCVCNFDFTCDDHDIVSQFYDSSITFCRRGHHVTLTQVTRVSGPNKSTNQLGIIQLRGIFCLQWYLQVNWLLSSIGRSLGKLTKQDGGGFEQLEINAFSDRGAVR